ncbi:MAG: ATP-binding protein [Promethearchaeota archaeon]
MYGISALLMFVAVFVEYHDTFIRSKPREMQIYTSIDVAVFLSLFIMGVHFFLVGTLLLGMVMLLRIYAKKRTPTHSFLCLSLFGAFLSTLTSILDFFGIEGALEMGDGTAIFFLTMLLITGIVALIEDRLLKSEMKYREAYNQAEFYKDIFIHDIGNMLQSIHSSTDVFLFYLKEQEYEINEAINIIKEQVKRGAILGSNIKKFSELESGEANLVLTDVCETLNEAIEHINKSFQDKKINIQVKPTCTQFYVKANHFLLNMFENLLFNAVKHNNNPMVEILIKMAKEKNQNIEHLKIEVIDNGVGIPDEMKKIIFQRPHERPEKFSRRGLGLALVSEIVKSYNGQIWVENNVQDDCAKGSRFIIIIPEAV